MWLRIVAAATLTLLTVFGLALVAQWAVAPQPAHDRARVWPSWLSACQVEGLDRDARCGRITVPESADAPNGRQIPIHVVVIPAAAATPLPDPLLLLVGGPGQGAATLAPALARGWTFARDTRDLVLIDQRGTGQSNGLACPPAVRAQKAFGNIFDPARLAACRDALSARADLTRYTTAIAAADYATVLDALGYGTVNLWGGSYGSRMGLELTRQIPHRIRTLTVEGVAPTFFTWPAQGARDAEQALEALIADCEADSTCARSFPTFRQDVDAAFAAVGRAPVTSTVHDPASGRTERVTFGTTDLAYATRGLLYTVEALSLPRLFRAAAAGNVDAFAQAYLSRRRTLDRQIATGVHLGVYCAEDVPFVDPMIARGMASGTRIGTYLLDQYRRACEVWPRGRIPAGFREPIRTSVPTLLLAGRRDPITPPRTAEAAARTLTRARILIWRTGGHNTDGMASPECRQGILRAFLDRADPDRLSIDCMSRDPIRPFEVSGVQGS